jgi:hypothetical protein
VKGRSVRSGGNVLTTFLCSASGISAICCDLTRPTITRLARTFRSTRTRHRREQYMPLVAFCLRHFLADFIICTCVFDFRQAQATILLGKPVMFADQVFPGRAVLQILQNRRNLSLWREYALARIAFGGAPLAVVPGKKSFDSRGSRAIDQLSWELPGRHRVQ